MIGIARAKLASSTIKLNQNRAGLLAMKAGKRFCFASEYSRQRSSAFLSSNFDVDVAKLTNMTQTLKKT